MWHPRVVLAADWLAALSLVTMGTALSAGPTTIHYYAVAGTILLMLLPWLVRSSQLSGLDVRRAAAPGSAGSRLASVRLTGLGRAAAMLPVVVSQSLGSVLLAAFLLGLLSWTEAVVLPARSGRPVHAPVSVAASLRRHTEAALAAGAVVVLLGAVSPTATRAAVLALGLTMVLGLMRAAWAGSHSSQGAQRVQTVRSGAAGVSEPIIRLAVAVTGVMGAVGGALAAVSPAIVLDAVGASRSTGFLGLGILAVAFTAGALSGLRLRLASTALEPHVLGLALGIAGVSVAVLGATQQPVVICLAAVSLGLAVGGAVAVGPIAAEGQVGSAEPPEYLHRRLVRAGLVSAAFGLAAAPLLASQFAGLNLSVGAVRLTGQGEVAVCLLAGVALAATGAAAYGQVSPRATARWRDLVRPVRGESEVLDVPGVLIAFEGGDGAGKSTQATELAQWLTENGVDVLLTREPGATEVGEALRSLVLDPRLGEMSPRAEALIYAADRAEHVEKVVLPALNEGRVVITDRYIDSSIAYQGVGRGLGTRAIAEISRWATGALTPDLTILLDVPQDDGRARRGSPGDRVERQSAEFHDAVRQAFLDRAEQDPARYLVVDATASVARIRQQVRSRASHLVDLPGGVGQPKRPAAEHR
jgi:dTMP kinase